MSETGTPSHWKCQCGASVPFGMVHSCSGGPGDIYTPPTTVTPILLELAQARRERDEARAERDRARDLAAGLEAQLAEIAALLDLYDTSETDWARVFDDIRKALNPHGADA